MYINEIKVPEYSDWEVLLVDEQVIVTPEVGKVPNWFHRKMQELILGFKWRKK